MLGDDKAKALSATLPGGITPLHYAAQLNDSEIVFRLLAAGANPNAQTSGNQTTPLHWAADKGSADALRFLLKDKADVSLKTKKGFTALHFAALGPKPELAKHLVDAGADLAAADDDGNTPLHLAAVAGKLKGAETLLASARIPP